MKYRIKWKTIPDSFVEGVTSVSTRDGFIVFKRGADDVVALVASDQVKAVILEGP